MTIRIELTVVLVALLVGQMAGPILAQEGPWRKSAADGPDQPVHRQGPTLRHVAPAGQAPSAPFRLSPQHEAYLDQVLRAWERHSNGVKTFECDFTRWRYDGVFGDGNNAKYRDDGKIKYASPDRGMFKVESDRAEHWVCDGQSIFEYNFTKKQLIEHQLPPHLQGKAIAQGPLPFLFGAKADELKRRYWMRIITPPHEKKQIWLEAHPKHQQDAANLQRAELILNAQDMQPHAMQIYEPNGKDRTAYQFYNIVINDPLKRFFQINPFAVSTPLGWKKIVERPQPAGPPAPRQAADKRRPSESDRR